MQQDHEARQSRCLQPPSGSLQDPSRSFPLLPDEAIQDVNPSQDREEGYSPESKLSSSRTDALFQWPNFYRIITQPSVTIFERQLPNANWKRLILLLTVFVVIRASLSSSPMQTDVPLVLLSRSLSAFFIVSLFFGVNALQYSLAAMEGGEGNFLEQVYTNLLLVFPLSIISGVLPLILVALAPMTASGLSSLANAVIGVYAILLNTLQIQASHCLDLGRAAGVVLISVILLGLLIFMLSIPLHILLMLLGSWVNGLPCPFCPFLLERLTW